MKQGRTIQEVAREILRQKDAKQDYSVRTTNMRMENSGGTPILRLLNNEGIDRVEPLDIQETAHRQLGAYLNIPLSIPGPGNRQSGKMGTAVPAFGKPAFR